MKTPTDTTFRLHFTWSPENPCGSNESAMKDFIKSHSPDGWVLTHVEGNEAHAVSPDGRTYQFFARRAGDSMRHEIEGNEVKSREGSSMSIQVAQINMDFETDNGQPPYTWVSPSEMMKDYHATAWGYDIVSGKGGIDGDVSFVRFNQEVQS